MCDAPACLEDFDCGFAFFIFWKIDLDPDRANARADGIRVRCKKRAKRVDLPLCVQNNGQMLEARPKDQSLHFMVHSNKGPVCCQRSTGRCCDCKNEKFCLNFNRIFSKDGCRCIVSSHGKSLHNCWTPQPNRLLMMVGRLSNSGSCS